MNKITAKEAAQLAASSSPLEDELDYCYAKIRSVAMTGHTWTMLPLKLSPGEIEYVISKLKGDGFSVEREQGSSIRVGW